MYGTVGAPTPMPGQFQTNGEVPREFQQSVMEMSDDSITSIDPNQQGGPHDWSSGHILSSTAANVSSLQPVQPNESRISNGAYTNKENGKLTNS